MHGTVYAFNADAPGSAALWSRSVGTARTSVPQSGPFYSGGEVGCIATPTVDTALNVVFALCANSTPAYTLAKISLADGSITSSVTVTASTPGTGDPGTTHSPGEFPATEADNVSGGILTFFPKYQVCRMALTITAGSVYLGCSSFFDQHPWHGWIMAYSETTMAQTAALCLSPNGWGGGVWNSGAAPAVDGSGNIFAVVGNGSYDAVTEWGMSAIKLNSSLAIQDWFTPSNFATMVSNDQDLGSSPPMLIPSTNLLAWGSKDYNVYSLNTTCMGHLAGTVGGCTAPQVFGTGSVVNDTHSGIYGGSFMNGIGYFPNTNGGLYAFTLTGSTWNTSPTISSTFAYPGAATAGSINATTNGLLWAITVDSTAFTAASPGVLRAVNPSTLAELYNSGVLLGNITKWSIPTIANGRVYVPTLGNAVQVFGLPPTSGVSGPLILSGPTVVQ